MVDARRLVTHIHRDPRPDGYAEVRQAAATEAISPRLVPTLGVRLADLGLEPLLDDEAEERHEGSDASPTVR